MYSDDHKYWNCDFFSLFPSGIDVGKVMTFALDKHCGTSNPSYTNVSYVLLTVEMDILDCNKANIRMLLYPDNYKFFFLL